MIIEFRNNDYETKVHLVNENTEKECFQRIDLSQGMNEYGNGNKLFFFEAAGRYDSAVLDIIHANSIEEAQELVNEIYKDRFERKTIIPLPIKEIIDERLADWTRKSNPIRAIQTPFWNWICPTCREGIGLEYECSKCGQKILWGNKENQ